MYNKDFVLRMIEMLSDLIAGILGLLKEGKIEEASEKLDTAYYDFLKEDAAFFRNIPIENLTQKLLVEHNYTLGHLEILSELFCAEAELQAANNKKESAREYFQKALALHEYVVKESNSFSFEQQNKMSSIKRKIVELGC